MPDRRAGTARMRPSLTRRVTSAQFLRDCPGTSFRFDADTSYPKRVSGSWHGRPARERLPHWASCCERVSHNKPMSRASGCLTAGTVVPRAPARKYTCQIGKLLRDNPLIRSLTTSATTGRRTAERLHRRRYLRCSPDSDCELPDASAATERDPDARFEFARAARDSRCRTAECRRE